MREIIITISNNRITASTDFAGYQGEHNATTLKFELPTELQKPDYTYKANITLPDGITATADIADMSLSLTQSLTANAGIIQVQVVIIEDNKLVYKSGITTLKIKQSLAPTTVIDNGSGISSMVVNDNGYLIVTLLDGKEINAGYVKGDKGEQGDPYTLTDEDKQVIASDVSNGIVSQLSNNIIKKTVSAIDESATEGANALTSTRRWFLDVVIPIGATVSELSYHTYVYGKGTVTFEFWEKDGNTLTKVHSVDTTATISNLINVDVNYTAKKDTMISIVSTVAAVSYTTDGGSILVSSDMTSDVLDYTTLATWSNFTPNVTLKYTKTTPINYVKKATNIITVGSNGCDYASIQDALEGITDDTEDNPYTILVYPSGTPYSRFSTLRKLDESYPWSDVKPRNISIIGLDKAHCVVQSDNGEYSTPPAEIMTNGIIKNLTFKMTNDKPLETPLKGGYACHIDCRTLDDVGYKMVIEDCDFESATGSAVGIGLHPNTDLTFRRCHFKSTAKEDYLPNDSYKNLATYGCVFAHTSQLADAQNQRLTFEDCVGACEEGAKSIWITPSGDYSQDTSDFVYTLLRNIFWNNKTENSAYVIGTTLTANPMNYGNNN